MSTTGIFPIVEGRGDEGAVRALIQRFAHEVHARYDFRVAEPFRLQRTKFAKDAEVESAIRFGAIELKPFARRHVLLVMDADDDCPAEQHTRVMRIADGLALPVAVSFVMPVREFEAWFIGCLDRARPHPELRDNPPPAPDLAGIRDAKGWFRANMLVPGRPYSPSVDQERFTYRIDLASSHDRAFVKLRKEMEAIFAA